VGGGIRPTGRDGLRSPENSLAGDAAGVVEGIRDSGKAVNKISRGRFENNQLLLILLLLILSAQGSNPWAKFFKIFLNPGKAGLGYASKLLPSPEGG
ncbi:MAG: hypothetical protein ACM3YE_09695, partial [Bacteroidota bacterium]